MADADTIELSPPHTPKDKAIEAFSLVEHDIKNALVKSRKHWDQHEPDTYASVKDVSDHDLASFSIPSDLVAVRAGATSYGVILLGKIRLPKAGSDAYIHARILDAVEQGNEEQRDVKFHSLYTEEPGEGQKGYRGILTKNDPIKFFNE